MFGCERSNGLGFRTSVGSLPSFTRCSITILETIATGMFTVSATPSVGFWSTSWGPGSGWDVVGCLPGSSSLLDGTSYSLVSFVFDLCFFCCFLSFFLQRDTRRNRMTRAIRPMMVTIIVLVRFQLSLSVVRSSCITTATLVAVATVVAVAVRKKIVY